MSTKYRFSDNEVPHFVTMTLVEWIDLFSREKYKELIIENLKINRRQRPGWYNYNDTLQTHAATEKNIIK